MNNSFILLDKTNNIQKNANIIVKFIFEEKDYLIYSIDENEQNKQIFVSKLILNSEGKYFIENISPEEKNKLNNIVYNIVILAPSNAKKGGIPSNLIKELTDKFLIKLTIFNQELSNQEYYNNCSIAITGKEFVEDAVKFYNENLIENTQVVQNTNIPTWSVPTEPQQAVQPAETIQETVVPAQTIPVQNVEQVVEQPTTMQPEVKQSVPVEVQPENVVPKIEVIPNPQMEKIEQVAVVSDPSLGFANNDVNMQPNVGKKNAGFAVNKYIVIGTICILLAVGVVIAAYILIQKMTTGA